LTAGGWIAIVDFQTMPAGARFKLFPQAPFLHPGAEPETVWVTLPPGGIGPGPQDRRMYVIDPIGKTQHYGITQFPNPASPPYLPPWDGPSLAPALPDPAGNFDYLEPGSRQFEMAHLYASVRFTLDVWERYFGHPIAWHFRPPYERLELSLLRTVKNAFAGFGFLEVGAHVTDAGEYHPFSLSFDIVAHEVGHLIIYSEVGLPVPELMEDEYFGFHESAADLVALLAVLHFDSVVERLLKTTSGNLYTLNELNRFAELSEDEEIRIAGNGRRISEFVDGWTKEHDLSEPLTGALFDILVDIFHESLLERGLIKPEVEDLADQVQRVPEYEPLIQALFDEAYAVDPEGFREALLEARDYLGLALAETWRRLPAESLNYEDVAAILLGVERDLSGGRFARLMRENFLWREIGLVRVGPRLTPLGADSHAVSPRTVVPMPAPRSRRPSYRERWHLARQHV
jgi:hypothetical protein